MEQLADGKYSRWRLVDVAIGTRIDGGDPNSNANVALVHPRGEAGGLHLQLAWAKFINRGSAANFGVGVRVPKSLWRFGQWTHGTTTFTDDTTDAQDAGATDAALETTTNGDGCLIAATWPFSAVAFNVATASTGSPVRAIEYSQSGGAWGTIVTTASMFPGATANYSVGENVCWFVNPSDWVPMVSGHGTNVPTGMYGLRIRATTAPTVAAVASTLSVHDIQLAKIALGNFADATVEFGGLYAPLHPDGEALVMATTVPSAQNGLQALVRTRG